MDSERHSAMNDWLKTVDAGRIADSVLGMAQATRPLHPVFRKVLEEMPFQEFLGLGTILKENARSVARFGKLTKSILATPVADLYNSMTLSN